MTIDTSQLDNDGDSPMAARISLLEAVQLLNRISNVITTPLAGIPGTIDISATGTVGIGMMANDSTLSLASFAGIYRAGRTAPHLTLRGSEGTLSAPTAVLLGHPLGRVSGGGRTPAGNWRPAGFIDFYASEDFTNTANGGYISLRTMPKGTTGDGVEIAQFTDTGCLIMGTAEVNGGAAAIARASFIGGVTNSGGEGTLYLQSSAPGTIPATVAGASGGMISLTAGGLLSTSARGGQIDLCGGAWTPNGTWGGLTGGMVFRTGTTVGLQPVKMALDNEGRLIITGGANSATSTIRGIQMMFDTTANVGRIYSSQSGVANYPLSLGVGGNQLFLHPSGHVGIGLDASVLPANSKLTVAGEGNSYTMLTLRDTRTAGAGTGGSLALNGYTDGFSGPTNFVTFHGYKENSTAADRKGAYRIYIDDGSGSPPVRFGMTSNGWACFGSGLSFAYGHGGNNKVVEIHNPNTTQNSQSHIVLSTNSTDLVNSSIGSVTFGMPNISVTGAGRVAHIGGVTSPNHTIAKPAGFLAFATKGPDDSTALSRVYIRDTGITEFAYSASITNQNAGLTVQSTLPTDTGVRFLSIGAGPLNQSWQHMYCLSNTSTLVFQIWGNGNVQNLNNSYAALSDKHKKEGIVNTSPKLIDFMKLRFVNYNLIADSEKIKQLGLISQEVELIFPGLVSESSEFVVRKDEKTGEMIKEPTGESVKNLKYSVLNVITAKVVQEVYAELAEEKARNAELQETVADLLRRLIILEHKVQ